jgi:CO dehydrogenase nickel-insertion accessory protein CooC1
MKICVCGKGGSGKSTVVALLGNGFKKAGKRVICIVSHSILPLAILQK